jgi:hypothetical protein
MENQNREEVLILLKSMHDEMKKKIKTNKTMLAEMIARMEASHEKRMARMDALLTDIKNDRKETMACQEIVEARLEVEEPASVDMTPEVADEEVTREGAARMPVGEPRKRRRDRRNLAAARRQKKKDRILDARCRGKEQERAQRKKGCLKNLVAARRETTRRAAMARRRILPTKDTNRELHGSQKRLVAARRGTTRRVQVARHK